MPDRLPVRLNSIDVGLPRWIIIPALPKCNAKTSQRITFQTDETLYFRCILRKHDTFPPFFSDLVINVTTNVSLLLVIFESNTFPGCKHVSFKATSGLSDWPCDTWQVFQTSDSLNSDWTRNKSLNGIHVVYLVLPSMFMLRFMVVRPNTSDQRAM